MPTGRCAWCRSWKAGLGTFNILWQIEQCRRLGLEHLYLGYWIEESPKMAYKSLFRPLEALRDGRWEPLESAPERTRP